ncbi:carbohydrate ABC transporter permease [Geminicoccaceae bacterium 1502E]|nr:carbohydrate ABC transporter permease [Geminicoccaceae bacterium 1502E]
MADVALPAAAAPADHWAAMAARSRRRRQWTTIFLYGFLAVASLPVIVPYLWLFTLAFSARGGTDTAVLWRALLVLGPALLAFAMLGHSIDEPRRLRHALLVLLLVTVAALAVVIGPQLHLANWRFLWNPDFSDALKTGPTGVGSQFPNVWVAFGNSLALALAVTAIVVTVSTLAGYYLSRFAFPGRAGFLKSLLVLHAFPAMTLIIPIFFLMHWAGLLDSILGVVLVVCTLELPFAIFIMKGFFDAVPWDIEMSAMTDGASRRQAFLHVVLPQVKFGMLAIGIFAFLRGWEDYVFVRTLLIDKQNWVMSLYLFYVAEDVMGVDYGIVTAVGVLYVLPALVLYTFTQKYLTQMTVGGIKG